MATREEPLTRRRAPTAHLAFAQIVLQDDALIGSSNDMIRRALRSSLRPGEAVLRYRKLWRMAKWQEQDGKYILGRIGFEREVGTTEAWNEKTLDFETRAALEGQTAPYAIRLSDLRVGFQIRTHQIERGSFTGALQALMNETAGAYRWKVVIEKAAVSWDEWVERVDGVTRLSISALPPNPNYRGKDQVEAVLEGADAKTARIVLEAREAGLNLTESDFVRQFIEHAEAGYGSVKAEGVLRRGRRRIKTRFDSDQVLPTRDVPARLDDREAPHSAIVQEVDRDAPELLPALPRKAKQPRKAKRVKRGRRRALPPARRQHDKDDH